MPTRRRYAHLQQAIIDARSGRVVFVSHCLLNQNTPYLGGAVCPGVVAGAVGRYIEDGTGIVQMASPEQRVWGGVLKTRLLWVVDHRWVARAGPVLVRLMLVYLRRRYVRLAGAVADDIEDCLASGFTVTGVVGGRRVSQLRVHTTLDLPAALAAMSRCRRTPISAAWMNDTVIQPALRPGCGLFIQALTDEAARRQLTVPIAEHSLTPTGS